MSDKPRIRIAAAVTALFLAGISAAGVAARDHQRPAQTTVAASDAPASGGGGYAEILQKARQTIHDVMGVGEGHEDDD